MFLNSYLWFGIVGSCFLSKSASTIYNLIRSKTVKWIAEEKENSQSLISNILRHIEEKGKLRQPQKEALEVYLWLKFVGENKKGMDERAKQGLYPYRSPIGYKMTEQNNQKMMNYFIKCNFIMKLIKTLS